jgi:ubiquinol-cytochrome c reductase cytochrome c1 subunit
MPTKFTSIVLTLLIGAGAAQANEGGHATWQRSADNEVANLASLQRGAKNFMAYCSGCHSLKYARYSRVAEDLKINDELRDQFLVKPGAKFTDYIHSSMPEKDATEWFGKVPPDLSLVARSRSPDWIFNFLTTFYADEASRQTGVNNLQLPGTAMPHVLASLQGVQRLKAQHTEEEKKAGPEASAGDKREESKEGAVASGDSSEPPASGGPSEPAEHGGESSGPFEPGVQGSLTAAQYDDFVRDTVNFLQYVSDPTQVERQSLGIWVVLFLLMFTGIAYMLKQEYWKDVR